MYDSLSVLGTLPGTILVILNILKIKLVTCVISLNTLWDEESEIFLQIKLSIENGSNIGLNHGFLRIFLTFLRYTPIWILEFIISNEDFCSQIHSNERT
jgi:hypothetical protein